MTVEQIYKHWKINRDEAGIAWLEINSQGESVNTLSNDCMQELDQITNELNINLPSGLVLSSGKQNGFIAGAEISEFIELQSAKQAEEYISFVHSVFNRIEAMPVPKVALIHGFCLGGGLELALTFDYLIADKESNCKLGLPEVKLGIHPGFGGSVRLIERIGVIKAMELMLAGRVIVPYVAKKTGVIDVALSQRYFKTAALDYIKRAPEKKRASKLHMALQLKPARLALSAYLKKQVATRANPKHYPAPFALIDVWRNYGGDRDEMLEQEVKSISRLFLTPTSRNLVRIFFLQERLKAVGKKNKVKKMQRLHVIGAGVMGGDIAAWSALRGMHVTLQDKNPESIARAMMRAQSLFKKKLKIPRLVQNTMDRLIPDLAGNGIAKADLIIEAIFENLEVKRQVFANVEKQAHPDAILASNTSSIPIEDIAKALKEPQRLVGIHYFNPVAKMQLVEVVKGAQTMQKVINVANAYALQISRMPVEVKSSPGFLINRVLMPYLIEAVTMLDEGEKGEHLDQAATDFGMPMGPVELADVVGLDICLHVAENLLDKERLPKSLSAKVKKGDLGKKTGFGYYVWSKGKPTRAKSKESFDMDVLSARMLYPLLNECVACLREGVVASADELDAGVIFGTGYAPFKGGPMQMIRDEGADNVVARLLALQSKHGERFKPDAGWDDLSWLNEK